MTSECCDGTGYADYAAVPCPNPKCPVVITDEMEKGSKSDD